MASVKGSNTSKTAHVMNLLSRSRGTESPLPTDSAAASAALPEDAHSPQPPLSWHLCKMIWQSPLPLRTPCRHPWKTKQKHQRIPSPIPSRQRPPFHRKIPCRTHPLPRKCRRPHPQPPKKMLKRSRPRNRFPLPQSARPPVKTLCSF